MLPPFGDTTNQLPSIGYIKLNSIISFTTQSSAWYLNSSTTHHITGNSQLFYTLHYTFGNNLHSVGGHSHTISSIGCIHFRFPDGNMKTIPRIMYSPTIQKNLLLVGFIANQNHGLEFTFERCYI
jgi:hypothetical protein